MAGVLVVFAHPQLQYSRVNRAMLAAIDGLDGVALHDLYELYPDFHIDVAREKRALEKADVIVLQHPFQWYSGPALLKEWIDLVLQKGWAYGPGGDRLAGKTMVSAISTGGPEDAYRQQGDNRFTIAQLLAPFEQTARLCGMSYAPPILFHDALRAGDAAVAAHAADWRRRLAAWAGGGGAAP